MSPDLVSKVYVNVVLPITEWQIMALQRNELDKAITLQNIIDNINILLSEAELDNTEILKAKRISQQWAEKYHNDMTVANAKIKELQRIIQEEEYFRTRSKHDR